MVGCACCAGTVFQTVPLSVQPANWLWPDLPEQGEMVAGARIALNLRRIDLLRAVKDLPGTEERVGLFRTTA